MKGKRVAVLGGQGFVGNHLAEQLVGLGADVVVMDNGSRGSCFRAKATYISIDVTNVGLLYDYLLAHEVEVVFNLAAAVAGLYYNVNHHTEMFTLNATLQAAPIFAAERAGVEMYCNVSSVCAYPDMSLYHKPVLSEGGILDGVPNEANLGYGYAKRVGIHLGTFTRIPHFVTVAPTNIAGPGDYFDEKAHVIPALVKRALTEEKLTVYGNPEYIREFVHVEDAARGMIVALTKGKHRGVYNIGGPHRVNIGKLATMIRDGCAPDKDIHFAGGEGGDKMRYVDSTRLKALGWKPGYPLVSIIRQTKEDYLERYG